MYAIIYLAEGKTPEVVQQMMVLSLQITTLYIQMLAKCELITAVLTLLQNTAKKKKKLTVMHDKIFYLKVSKGMTVFFYRV